MTTPWIQVQEPSDTIKAIAAAVRESHDPATIAQRALERRNANAEAREAAIMAASDDQPHDPRTTAEKLLGLPYHEAGYEHPRAKRFIEPGHGPREKRGAEDDAQIARQALIDLAVRELGLSRDQAMALVNKRCLERQLGKIDEAK